MPSRLSPRNGEYINEIDILYSPFDLFGGQKRHASMQFHKIKGFSNFEWNRTRIMPDPSLNFPFIQRNCFPRIRVHQLVMD